MRAIINFIKPSLKKVIFFLILAIPHIGYLLYQYGGIEIISMESGFYTLFRFNLLAFESIAEVIFVCLCTGFGHCTHGAGAITYFLSYLVPFLILWFVACFLSWTWDKIISIKRKKVS